MGWSVSWLKEVLAEKQATSSRGLPYSRALKRTVNTVPWQLAKSLRRLVSCSLLKLALPDARDYFAPHQVASGVPSSAEIAIHAFLENMRRLSNDPGRAALFIDTRNAFNEVDRHQIMDAVVVHAPGVARYVHMVYGCAPWLVAGRHLILSPQGTQQGDPLGNFLFSIFSQTLIGKLQADLTLNLIIWCADDDTLIGEIPQLVAAT